MAEPARWCSYTCDSRPSFVGRNLPCAKDGWAAGAVRGPSYRNEGTERTLLRTRSLKVTSRCQLGEQTSRRYVGART